jgi:hypothetical protein
MKLEDGMFGGGFLAGIGVALVAPRILAALGSVAAPVAQTVVKSAMTVVDAVRELAAETSDALGDLVAEVRAERAGSARPPAVRH